MGIIDQQAVQDHYPAEFGRLLVVGILKSLAGRKEVLSLSGKGETCATGEMLAIELRRHAL